MNRGDFGPPAGIGYRLVTQTFLTAASYQWVAPADIQPWTGVLFEVVGGGADGAAGATSAGNGGASGGSGGGSGGGVRGLRRGFCPGQSVPLVVGAKASSSSVTLPSPQGGNMTATGGTAGAAVAAATLGTASAAVAGGAAGTGSGTSTDETITGQAGGDSDGGAAVTVNCGGNGVCSGGRGGRGGDAPLGFGSGGQPGGGSANNGAGGGGASAAKAGTGRGSGGGGGGGGAGGLTGGALGAGAVGAIRISVWTQDPNYLDKVT